MSERPAWLQYQVFLPVVAVVWSTAEIITMTEAIAMPNFRPSRSRIAPAKGPKTTHPALTIEVLRPTRDELSPKSIQARKTERRGFGYY